MPDSILEINKIKKRLHNLTERTAFLMEIFDYNLKKTRLEKINLELEKPNIWHEPKRAKTFIKERSLLNDIIRTIDEIIHSLNDISGLSELILEENDNDKEFLFEIESELNNLEFKLDKLEFSRMFSGKHDCSDCYVDIQAGSGGTEAQDWTEMLLRMYLRWTESHEFKTEIIQKFEGEVAGIKSVTIKVKGSYAYGWFRTETGVHRLVRKSPFDSSNRRHTSFSSVFVYPEVEDSINIKINSSDLRIDVYRASGAGGQHVNRTESAVRITHLPTDIVTQCQSDRSQHKNKDQAMKQLKAKLYQFELQKKNAEKRALENLKSDIGWGNQIRSYVLDDGRVKDLRTGLETHDVQSILDGNLDKFIETSLKAGL